MTLYEERKLYGNNTKDCYYSNLWEAYIFDYYENDSFPMFGWIKPCIYCVKITSSYMTRNNNKKEIIIHACKKCIDENKNNKHKERKIKKYLKKAIYFENHEF